MADPNFAFTVTLVDALARLGVEHACITPGSRSTPLALALAEDDRITDWSHHDERSSAFFALGIARTTRRPALIVTTSGTAAAELYPAVVEARYGRVPLIALTADRPFELREVGAPQTIDQQNLFGAVPAWSHDIEVTGAEEPATIAALAARMVALATGTPPAPVHLNLRFREPLVPSGDMPRPAPVAVPEVMPGRLEPTADQVDRLAALVAGRRGVLVAGPQDDPALPEAAVALARAAGWPILADPLSGLRAGSHDLGPVLAYGDPLAWAGWLERAHPEVVVRLGALPTSKPVGQWLGAHPEVDHLFIEPAGWRDPTASATTVIRAAPAPTLEALGKAMTAPAPAQWAQLWQAADRAAGEAVRRAVQSTPFPNEPAVPPVLAGSLPDPSVLWVASSMPVRDVDAFFGVTRRRIRLLANRGANGIDGFISAGLGSAAVARVPTYLLAGDLSLLHDLNALATAARLDLPVTIVTVNNDGGGIFHFLPQEGHRHFERHFATPHGLDLTAVASALGMEAAVVDTLDDLTEAVAAPPDRPRMFEVRTDRGKNVTIHRNIRRAVEQALEGL